MKKNLEIKKLEKTIEIFMNSECIYSFEIGKNKINGQVLYEKLDIHNDDVFVIIDGGSTKSTMYIDDVVIKNTYVFMNKLCTQINKTLDTINGR